MTARLRRSGQHAEHQHREKVAKIVHSLFTDTRDNAQLVHVKKAVFDVDKGAPIMGREHPAIRVLLKLHP